LATRQEQQQVEHRGKTTTWWTIKQGKLYKKSDARRKQLQMQTTSNSCGR